MLRIKRTVAAQFTIDVSYGFVREEEKEESKQKPVEADETRMDETKSAENKRKVENVETEPEQIKKKVNLVEAEDANMEIDLEQQNVPSTVFGDAIEKAKEEAHQEKKKKLGALDRFKQ